MEFVCYAAKFYSKSSDVPNDAQSVRVMYNTEFVRFDLPMT